MKFEPLQLYHFYTRGNNKQKIFFHRGNYLFFLKKIRRYILPYSDILNYCLMPNHFHFLIYTKENLNSKSFSNSIRILLSSYTRAIQIEQGVVGSLFQQNSKAKLVSGIGEGSNDYAFVSFNYNHQNPLKAGLVHRMEDWEFSSYQDYIGLRDGSLCNQSLAFELIDFGVDFTKLTDEARWKLLKEISLQAIDPEKMKIIF